MNTSHYPSLELCKKLRDIGFPETEHSIEFYRAKSNGTPEEFIKIMSTKGQHLNDGRLKIICPSVMEMLDVMPHEIHIKEPKHTRWLHIGKDTVSYMETNGTKYPNGFMFMDSVLPNAIAEMILWLHENKHITFQNGN